MFIEARSGKWLLSLKSSRFPTPLGTAWEWAEVELILEIYDYEYEIWFEFFIVRLFTRKVSTVIVIEGG